MKYIFHPETETEFFDSIDYYEKCENELGFDFSLEVYSTSKKILEYPKAWPILEDDIRRCLVNRFPFGILYIVETDHIHILAIMHLHRDPDYWKHRK